MFECLSCGDSLQRCDWLHNYPELTVSMKIIEIIADAGHKDTLVGIAEQNGISDIWCSAENECGQVNTRMLVGPDARQPVLDALQKLLMASDNVQIVILPVEATIKSDATTNDAEEEKKAIEKATSISREEIFAVVEKGVKLDNLFLLLVFLSSMVAAIGLLENNVAVIIGAMVIAPLLGPNLGFALGASLGESELVLESRKTLFVGIMLAIGFSYVLGLFWPGGFDSHELISRTQVAYSTTAIALASGAAASLSLVSGVSSVLVGVMVAVALMPPAVTIGLMLSIGHYDASLGAFLLLAVNIVSIILSAKLVFLFRGIKPRTWLKAHKAKQSRILYILLWIALLSLLVFITALRVKTSI